MHRTSPPHKLIYMHIIQSGDYIILRSDFILRPVNLFQSVA